MKKRLMTMTNVALGSLSMLLAGCHTQKQAAQPAEPESDAGEPRIEQPIPVEPEPPVCKYGVPVEVYERPMRKYGIPDYRK
jgi:hypothetical protein